MHAFRFLTPGLALAFFLLEPMSAWAQTTTVAQEDYKPTPGQPGKDVVWVPTPEALVEKMLDVANVTPADLVVDLGSGDGRNVIAAARRGARARGVEYNPDMVALSRRNAERQGVSGRAVFVEGDMFAADFSDASVLALFLLPDNMMKLREKFFAMRPGSRIVANTFGMEGWEPDEKHVLGSEDDCASWCTALLWIVPARVAGTWRLPDGQLTLTQEFQKVSGMLATGGTSVPITEGRLRGTEISFTAGSTRYTGLVKGNGIAGVVRTNERTSNWTASRVAQ
jgi:SAM-dependent methyltransferase